MHKGGVIAALAVALVVVVVGVAAYISYSKTTPVPVVGDTTVFNSTEIGISFTYPQNYQLAVSDDEEGAVRIITLVDKANLPVGQNTEGPQSIAVQRFDNPQSLPLDEWIRVTPASNWKLSSQGEMGASTVGDKAGLGYTYSGLYEETAIAVANGDKIYVFSVGTNTAEDKIKTDFFSLLDTVQFI